MRRTGSAVSEAWFVVVIMVGNCDGNPVASGKKRLCYSPIMWADSDIVPECIVRPGSLGGLISLYEGNFIKLAALLGDPTVPDGRFVSQSPRDGDLHLSIEEGSRYTRLLRLTYWFDEPPVTGWPTPTWCCGSTSMRVSPRWSAGRNSIAMRNSPASLAALQPRSTGAGPAT